MGRDIGYDGIFLELQQNQNELLARIADSLEQITRSHVVKLDTTMEVVAKSLERLAEKHGQYPQRSFTEGAWPIYDN